MMRSYRFLFAVLKQKQEVFYWLSNLAKVEVINDDENRCKSIWKSKNRGLEAERKRCGSVSGEVILVGLFDWPFFHAVFAACSWPKARPFASLVADL